MKKIYAATLALALGFLLNVEALAQKEKSCDLKEFTNRCVQKLRPQGYRFLKSYKIQGKANQNVTYSYVFNRGTTYLITLAGVDPNNKGLKVTLLDAEKKHVISSYSNDTKIYNSQIEIRCQRTGIYHFAFSHDDKQDFCAASVLGFKR